MYEDIYKGLTEEQRLEMIKADIPKFEIVGEFDLTEEMEKDAVKALQRFEEECERAQKNQE